MISNARNIAHLAEKWLYSLFSICRSSNLILLHDIIGTARIAVILYADCDRCSDALISFDKRRVCRCVSGTRRRGWASSARCCGVRGSPTFVTLPCCVAASFTDWFLSLVLLMPSKMNFRGGKHSKIQLDRCIGFLKLSKLGIFKYWRFAASSFAMIAPSALSVCAILHRLRRRRHRRCIATSLTSLLLWRQRDQRSRRQLTTSVVVYIIVL